MGSIHIFQDQTDCFTGWFLNKNGWIAISYQRWILALIPVLKLGCSCQAAFPYSCVSFRAQGYSTTGSGQAFLQLNAYKCCWNWWRLLTLMSRQRSAGTEIPWVGISVLHTGDLWQGFPKADVSHTHHLDLLLFTIATNLVRHWQSCSKGHIAACSYTENISFPLPVNDIQAAVP